MDGNGVVILPLSGHKLEHITHTLTFSLFNMLLSNHLLCHSFSSDCKLRIYSLLYWQLLLMKISDLMSSKSLLYSFLTIDPCFSIGSLAFAFSY